MRGSDGLDRDALDRYITGGRYSSERLLVACPGCGETTPVDAESEYGATTWSPEECPKCGREFEGDEKFEADEGPDVEYDYQDREEA